MNRKIALLVVLALVVLALLVALGGGVWDLYYFPNSCVLPILGVGLLVMAIIQMIKFAPKYAKSLMVGGIVIGFILLLALRTILGER